MTGAHPARAPASRSRSAATSAGRCAAVVDGPPGRVFVVELSSFQIEGIVTFKPRAAALLNLAEDHLDRYGDHRGLRSPPSSASFRNQDPDGIAVLNADEPEAAASPTRRATPLLLAPRPGRADGC